MANSADEQIHMQTLAREHQKHERLKARVDAAEENMKQALAAELRQQRVKEAIVAEGVQAVRAGKANPNLHKEIAGKKDVWGSLDRDIPTGYDDGSYVTVESYSSVDYN